MASSSAQVPTEAPPPYSRNDPTPHKTRNGIPPDRRRSMEDESRPLPEGWIRQFDPDTAHFFFVDTRTERSIWHHPYDDDQYMATLSPEERARIKGLHRVPTDADIIAESSDDEAHDPHGPPKRQDSHPNGMKRFGRKIKDKVTSTTHQQREAQRKKRAEEEARAYQQHLATRQAMARCIQTGKPQLLGKDRQGQDVYISPPQGIQGSQVPNNARVINPFGSSMGMGGMGMYGRPAGAYMQPYGRPAYPYGRPYGYGYGGGMGLPILGGLTGGLLLGGMMGGF